MCTVIVVVGQDPDWPLLMAANRDERLDRACLAPGRHWADQPDVIAGLDVVGGGTWLGVNDAGVVATVLNRAGTLGPAPGKQSRGVLPLLALRHGSARAAAVAIAALDGGLWRGFNLVVADRDGAIVLRGMGVGAIVARDLAPGVHMVTASDPDDMGDPRVARHLPRFRAASLPRPPDWGGWYKLLGDDAGPREAALFVPERNGFGTVGSTFLGVGPGGVVFDTAG